MKNSLLMKINPTAAVQRIREVTGADQLMDAIDNFFDGFEGVDELPTPDDMKEYLVSTGVVAEITPDIDAIITQQFNDKINSQEELPEVEDEDSVIGPADLQFGDILDMGSYGNSIVYINDADGRRFWGTDDIQEARDVDVDASGWYFEYADIIGIVGHISDDEYDDEDDSEFQEASMFAGNNSLTNGNTTPPSVTPTSTTSPTTTSSTSKPIQVDRQGKISALSAFVPDQDFSQFADKDLDNLLKVVLQTK